MPTDNDADAVGLAVGLVNTWDLLADPPDLIRDVPQIARWVRLHEEPGLEEAAARLTPSDLNRLRGVRDRLRCAFDAASEGEAVSLLNELLLETGAVPQLSAETRTWKYVPASKRASDVVVAVGARGLLEAIRAAGWERFGICAGTPCRCVYVDRSRNRSRAYCCQLCADRVNQAAYRRRKARGPLDA
jgi:predicted RNA-binding Zn ribbon-like protein